VLFIFILINVILQVKVGEVGGNTLGFYGGMFSPNGLSIMAHGYQGAFHHWSYSKVRTSKNKTTTCCHGYQGAFHHWCYSKVRSSKDKTCYTCECDTMLDL